MKENPSLPSGGAQRARFSLNPRTWLTLVLVLIAAVVVILLVNNMLLTTLQQVFRMLLTVLKYNIRLIVGVAVVYWLYKKLIAKR